MQDIVRPDKNEDGFAEMALRLGFSGLTFCYEQVPKNISDVLKDLLVSFSSLSFEVMQLVEKDKIKSKYPLVFSSGKETNVRAVVEKKKPQIITNLAFQQKDFMHHRAGINQVVAQAMHDNDVALGLSLPLLFSTKYKPEVMGRIMQNIVLARKHKVAVKAFTLANHPMNMRSPKDLISLLVLLGMDHKEAKSALRLR